MDFEAKSEPLKRGVQVVMLEGMGKNGLDIEVMLKVHEVAFDDELFNPLSQEAGRYKFLSTGSLKESKYDFNDK